MPKFEPKEPIETREPTIVVDGLPEGTHRFQLEVLNEHRKLSPPAFIDIRVTKEAPPPR